MPGRNRFCRAFFALFHVTTVCHIAEAHPSNLFLDFQKQIGGIPMKYWQRERNYRKIPRGDGSWKYIITIDGEDIEVDEEVYKAYSSSERRERYCYEREDSLLLSLDRLEEDNIPLASLVDKQFLSTEGVVLAQIESSKLWIAFERLTLEERQLINALVLDGVTERDYAAQIGISQKGVNKRKHKIFQKLLSFLVLK